MLEIWGRNNSINVQKVLWCCQELGLTYRRIDAGGPFKRTDELDYLALNPNGLVPTIVDDGFVLWESNAVVRYLARQYGEGMLWPAEPRAQARADMWMDWQTTAVWACLRIAFLGLVRTPEAERDHAGVQVSIEATAEKLWILDAHLADSSYVAGSGFSMGDIPLGATVSRWFRLDIERPPMPHLRAWYERLSQRSAYQEIVDSVPLT